jgi:hypothetical protein
MMTDERVFTDRTGVVWRVTEIAPAETVGDGRERRRAPRSVPRRGSAADRFATRPLARLCFTSGSTRRFVTSVPNGWMHMSDGDLEDLMAYARDR